MFIKRISDYKATEIAQKMVKDFVEKGICNFLDDVSFNTWVKDALIEEKGIKWYSGSSKACFWHPALENWVIKVGFYDLCIDYAKREYDIYLKAKSCGLEKYFPLTLYLGEFGGQNFYLQEKADCYPELVHSKLIQSVTEREGCESYSLAWDVVDDLEAEDRAWFLFGDSELVDFLLSNNINDLHEGNFGYIEEQLVIIDFSGWRG